MTNPLTRIAKGVEVTIIEGTPQTSCDLCDSKGEPKYYLWDLVDLPTAENWTNDEWVTAPGIQVLCPTCDREELAKVDEDKRADENSGWDNAAYQEWLAGHTGSPKTLTKSCQKSHYDVIDGKPGWGYLRLVSERGGKAIDIACDYGLFFSTGWKDVFEPDILRATYGKPEIPDLSTDDRSKWPSLAYIWWGDYKAPNPDIVLYAQWAAKEWMAGKNIQFGCFGAHGRTGTFLAMLLVETGMEPDGESAIKWVRNEYCFDAIEGKAQMDFLKDYHQGFNPAHAKWV